LGVWFFLYLPELLWNTQRIYPPIFFDFGWGCIIKPLDDQQVCINMWWRAIDDNHANASRAHEKRFKSPLLADDIATSRQQTGKKNDRFRLNAELWINRTTKNINRDSIHNQTTDPKNL
jgi:hypothetical protein